MAGAQPNSYSATGLMSKTFLICVFCFVFLELQVARSLNFAYTITNYVYMLKTSNYVSYRYTDFLSEVPNLFRTDFLKH